MKQGLKLTFLSDEVFSCQIENSSPQQVPMKVLLYRETHLKTWSLILVKLEQTQKSDCHLQKGIIWLCSLDVLVEKDFSLIR